MADIGYRVDVTQADPYTVPVLSKPTSPRLAGASPAQPLGLTPFNSVATDSRVEVGEPAPFVLKVIGAS